MKNELSRDKLILRHYIQLNNLRNEQNQQNIGFYRNFSINSSMFLELFFTEIYNVNIVKHCFMVCRRY